MKKQIALLLVLGIPVGLLGNLLDAGKANTAHATVTIPAIGSAGVVALSQNVVLLSNGEFWHWNGNWMYMGQSPVPAEEVVIYDIDRTGLQSLIDSSGNFWTGGAPGNAEWTNRGAPPVDVISIPPLCQQA